MRTEVENQAALTASPRHVAAALAAWKKRQRIGALQDLAELRLARRKAPKRLGARPAALDWRPPASPRVVPPKLN